MSRHDILIVAVSQSDSTRLVVEALVGLGPGQALLVHNPNFAVDDQVVNALLSAADAPLAATVSALAFENLDSLEHVAPADLAPPSLAVPRSAAVLLLASALSVVTPSFDPTLPWSMGLAAWADTARHFGFRHVATVGLVGPEDEWSTDAISLARLAIESGANSLLETHRLWARTRLRSPRIVIDGACISADSFSTGTHQVVINLTRGLALARPAAEVALAVGASGRSVAAPLLSDVPNVVVVPRNHDARFDLVYRPYQFLRANELAWTYGAADRVVLGQLDMIGFSNDSYHPDAAAFSSLRNLQRASLRRCDVVTTISQFAAATIVAECADLEGDRVKVVLCGTDHVAAGPNHRPVNLPSQCTEFVLCLAATFQHKNRPHAVRTFAELRRRGYTGSLVMAGPEPIYGRSIDAEAHALGTLRSADRVAVHHLGPVDEAAKWWLLEHARAVLYPSINEGFGLVPFEAAMVGTPALSATTASLPEVLGAAVTMASTWDVVEWADIITSWIDDPQSASHQVEAIRARSHQLSWHRSAIETWAAFDWALGHPRRIAHPSEGAVWAAMEAHRIGPSLHGNAIRNARRAATKLQRGLRER